MSVILRKLSVLGWGKPLIFLFSLWAIVVIYAALSIDNNRLVKSEAKTEERLVKAVSDLEELKRQNLELQNLFKDISLGDIKPDQKLVIQNFQSRLVKAERVINKQQDFGLIEPKFDPNEQYEVLRRKIGTNLQEFWYFISSEIVKVQKQANSIAPDLVQPLGQILSLGVEHKRSLVADVSNLAEVDGYNSWREREAYELSDLVQRRFKYLQNPANCNNAKKLICSLNKGCGYGCQLHHTVYCFLVAYGTERTLILKSKGWRYHKAGWEEIFKPVSETCTDPSGVSHSNWPGTSSTQVLTLPVIDALSPRSPYLPPAIPEDLASRLTRLHGDPIVWWVGQVLKYLLRPQMDISSLLQNAITNLGFKRPIVGIHVRRTDKVGTEAAFHGIEEYMAIVDEYYNQLELTQKVDQRRIYLASDDPKVFNDAKNKYPHYEILGDSSIAKTAAVSSRYSKSSLHGIILDIHLLSMSDYLVCTFSSQVCRVAYEIMQNFYPDAASRFRSLDDVYYFGGQNAHNRIAVLQHDTQKHDEINVMPGDAIGVAGNHWNGFSKGTNKRTNQIGLYPSFKVVDRVDTAKFPTYPAVPLVQSQSDDNR